ncbi:MAG: RES family NAD+ phosphorylase [Myxococcota bacterium]
MRVYRLCSPKHAKSAIDGEGARLFGGRWNPRGHAMVYTSEHLSLAVLEVLVHLEPTQLRPARVAVAVDIPDRDVESIESSALPKSWRGSRAQRALQNLGLNWLRERRSLALRVPSAVIPQEYNVLLNPAHPRHARLSPEQGEPFSFDPRLFRFPA